MESLLTKGIKQKWGECLGLWSEGGGKEGGYVLMFVNGGAVVMVGCSEQKKTA